MYVCYIVLTFVTYRIQTELLIAEQMSPVSFFVFCFVFIYVYMSVYVSVLVYVA